MKIKRGFKLIGGSAEQQGGDVLIQAPTANLAGRALATNERVDALIIPRDEPLNEVACFRCKGTDIVVKVKFPKDEGYQLALCRDCLNNRAPGKPIMIDMEFVE